MLKAVIAKLIIDGIMAGEVKEESVFNPGNHPIHPLDLEMHLKHKQGFG